MNTLKYIGIFLLVLLAIFICYGIYYAIIAYMFFIKLLAFASVIAWVLYLYFKLKNKKNNDQ